MSRVILLTGATGAQGSAVVDALLASPKSKAQFTILGVTRNPASPAAQRLAAKSPALKVIQGNFDDVPALFRAAREAASQRPVWGVFSVQQFMGQGQSTASEERQGKALIDESMKQGVKFFVQTSVDRGGDVKSWDTPTNVPHFASKHNIELYLRERTAAQTEPMAWTILRPVAFMDNLVPGFQTKVFLTALRQKLGSKPLQFVATEDIGKVAAQAFLHPESADYKNQALALAGDELTFAQMNELFLRKTGQPVPTTFGVLGWAFLQGVADLGRMVVWFGTDGYGADISKVRRLDPELMDLETWLEKKSKFELKK